MIRRKTAAATAAGRQHASPSPTPTAGTAGAPHRLPSSRSDGSLSLYSDPDSPGRQQQHYQSAKDLMAGGGNPVAEMEVVSLDDGLNSGNAYNSNATLAGGASMEWGVGGVEDLQRKSGGLIPPPIQTGAGIARSVTSGVSGEMANSPALADDEKVIQVLCDFEVKILFTRNRVQRIKANVHSCKEVSTFLKKRAQIEEDYGKAMNKLCQSVLTQKPDGKEGTFNEAWVQYVKLHEQIGDVRIKFGENITEVAEELSTLQKNTERSRKQ
ncbi:hypothetical protein HK101_001689, partial [Irineochytrium annulatum]